MIRCCYCGILVIITSPTDHDFMICPSCKEEIFAVRGLGRSFKKSEVTINYETKTINIKTENEIPQKAD